MDGREAVEKVNKYAEENNVSKIVAMKKLGVPKSFYGYHFTRLNKEKAVKVIDHGAVEQVRQKRAYTKIAPIGGSMMLVVGPPEQLAAFYRSIQ